MCEAWKSEIDNLLLFAGLFSGVVTPFTIQSFNWLKPDLTTQSVNLLERISRQLNEEVLPSLEPFATPTPSWEVVRINILWFLTLTLSLATAFIGILCIQWIRHYQSRIDANNHKDAISLRQMRYDGLLWWKVPEVLATLQFMLQTALILFCVGILELLWMLDKRAAIPITIVVGLTLAAIGLTSAIPVAQFLFYTGHRAVPQCPYKSPLSWLYSRGFVRFLHWLMIVIEGIFLSSKSLLPHTNRSVAKRTNSKASSHNKYRFRSKLGMVSRHQSWAEQDVSWYHLTDSKSKSSPIRDKADVPDALVNALTWINKTFSQSVDVVHTLYHCIVDLPPHIATRVISKLHPPGMEVLENKLIDLEPSGFTKEDEGTASHTRNDALLAIYCQKYVQVHGSLVSPTAKAYVRLLRHSNNPELLERLDFPDYLTKSTLNGSSEAIVNVISAVGVSLERDTLPRSHLECLFVFAAVSLKLTAESSSIMRLKHVVKETFNRCEIWVFHHRSTSRVGERDRKDACYKALLKLYDTLDDDPHHITPIFHQLLDDDDSDDANVFLMQCIRSIVEKLVPYITERAKANDPNWQDLEFRARRLSAFRN
ncbi:hypothetical protein AMATHDRAFT_56728 [Amanita thiersii Skay4041]|uniref:DUF6535 domain-containing protein n=1 Tax=Amanita thiersii Skay4041 TaxID=703135 RepID=A0A2A9NNW1_9AGAR|nr:hypothetical protein AMATHDRAFT_56728 [Amanita thiersii Skay4041]